MHAGRFVLPLSSRGRVLNFPAIVGSEIGVKLFNNGEEGMTIERKQYSAEFKREVVCLMTQDGQNSSQVAQELGINQGLLNKWKRQLDAAQQAQSTGRQNYEAFPGQGRSHDEELAQLRRENAALKIERDVLKKAIAIFAEPRPR